MGTGSDTSSHGRWLDAHYDSTAGLCSVTQCVALTTVAGDNRLVVADLRLADDSRPKLKVFSGTSLIAEQLLPDIPNGIVSFYMDRIQPLVAGIAVSCGSDVLIFKNNKPFFKYSLPSLPINELEVSIWHTLRDCHEDDVLSVIEPLKNIQYAVLTARSQELLNLPKEEVFDYVRQCKNAPLEKKSTITCITSLHRKEDSPEAVSCIVVGTEAGDVIVLDSQGFNILHQARVCSCKATPIEMSCLGQFDVEYRCLTACREGFVSILRRGWLEGRVLFKLTDGSIVAMAVIPGELSVIIATNKDFLQCYSKKGRKLWSVNLPYPIVTLTTVPLQHLSCTLTAVALKGGTVRLYKEHQHVDTIVMSNTVGALRFGPLGQEDCVMILITVDGTLSIKILKRTADFNIEMIHDNNNVSSQQARPLQIPKKTKLFLEQMNREKDNAKDIHQIFQQELFRLRLTAARAVVHSIKSGDQTTAPIRLSAQVLGLGPVFTLTISLENMSAEKSLIQLAMILHAPTAVYSIAKPFIAVPMLCAGFTHKFETTITEMNNNNGIDDQHSEESGSVMTAPLVPVKVFVVRIGQAQPLLAATIHMPPTDPAEFI